MGIDASWWKDTGTEVRSSIIILMACLNFILLRYIETGTMFSKWFGPSRSFRGRRRKMGGREREIRHLSKAYPSKKQSLFYKYLPYWADLEIHHAIDGMHLKKNVFGNTIVFLLETSAKTKDTLKSC